MTRLGNSRPLVSSACNANTTQARGSAAILEALRQLTGRTKIEFLPLAQDTESPPVYPPAAQYLKDLLVSKPETASEDLYTKLCEDLLKIHPTRQVAIRDAHAAQGQRVGASATGWVLAR